MSCLASVLMNIHYFIHINHPDNFIIRNYAFVLVIYKYKDHFTFVYGDLTRIANINLFSKNYIKIYKINEL